MSIISTSIKIKKSGKVPSVSRIRLDQKEVTKIFSEEYVKKVKGCLPDSKEKTEGEYGVQVIVKVDKAVRVSQRIKNMDEAGLVALKSTIL